MSSSLRESSLFFAICFGVLALLAPKHALADEAEGRRLLEQAVEAREAGQLIAAERLLRESLEEHAWTYPAFQLGSVLREMRRPVDALEVFDGLLEGAYGEVSGSARSELTSAIESTEAEVARVSLRFSRSVTAEVRVDGDVHAELANAEQTDLELNPGRRAILVQGTDIQDLEHTAEFPSGEITEVNMEVADRVAPASVLLRSEADVRIEVVGVASALGRLELSLPPSVYTIIASADGEQDQQELETETGQTYRLDLDRPGDSGVPVWVWIGAGILTAGAAALILGFVLSSDDPMLPIDNIGT